MLSHRLVKTISPEVVAGLCVDELHVHAHPLAAALDASLKHIANVELAPDPLEIDRLASEREGSVSPDHQHAAHAREIRSQAFRDPVDEIFLLGIAADVSEWQHHD